MEHEAEGRSTGRTDTRRLRIDGADSLSKMQTHNVIEWGMENN